MRGVKLQCSNVSKVFLGFGRYISFLSDFKFDKLGLAERKVFERRFESLYIYIYIVHVSLYAGKVDKFQQLIRSTPPRH